MKRVLIFYVLHMAIDKTNLAVEQFGEESTCLVRKSTVGDANKICTGCYKNNVSANYTGTPV